MWYPGGFIIISQGVNDVKKKTKIDNETLIDAEDVIEEQMDIEDFEKGSAKKTRYPDIVAFTGPKGSGKDTAAKVLDGYTNVKFAGALKAMMAALLKYSGCPSDKLDYWIEGQGKEEACPYLNGISPRHAMQTLGTEWGRKCMNENFWVQITEKHIRNEGLSKVVITDMRFPNERSMVEALGGVTVKIRPANFSINDAHESERHVMSMSTDIDVFNDFSGVDNFQTLIKSILDGFVK